MRYCLRTLLILLAVLPPLLAVAWRLWPQPRLEKKLIYTSDEYREVLAEWERIHWPQGVVHDPGPSNGAINSRVKQRQKKTVNDWLREIEERNPSAEKPG